MENEIINKVANSPLITIDLEEFFDQDQLLPFDLKDFLFHGLILKEKDYREALKNTDWSIYANKYVALFCSADAIVPTWAYMLAANYLTQAGAKVYTGTVTAALEKIYEQQIEELEIETYRDKMIVIKGCFDKPVPVSAYVKITNKLTPIVKSLMFGEACSTVPVYKRKA